MQALILAAGFGKRLQPLTNKIPKSLVEVNGTPLLINALNQLSNRNINEVIIVVGHKKEMIKEKIGSTYKNMKITYVENNLYNETNNVYSFYLAKEYIKEDLIMLECDLFYRRNLIDTILEGQAECNILVSKFDKETMNGTVIQIDDEKNAKALILKKNQDEKFDYSDKRKTVNIYTFKKEFIVNHFLPAIENYVKTESVNSYYELVLGSLIYFENHNIKVIEIDKSEWCEIDDEKDLKIAEKVFKNKK